MTELKVETCSGWIRGVVDKSSEGFDYCAFKGIPYAEPPIGNLRFEDSIPIKKWSGVRDATQYGKVSAQYDLYTKTYIYNEDCLHLNVYVKSINDSNPNKAVMVWFHGGGFFFGCANDKYYGADYLIRKDIVLVTVNYRLGALGFLNLEDEIAPGNQGLKDQVLALKWVQRNIKKFGGDSGNITIFGQSAGGASVHYMNLSPLGKGLFHKVISQSGVVFNCWAIVDNPKQYVHELCSLLGKNLTDSRAIKDFLKTVDCKALVDAQEKLRLRTRKLNFAPGIDDKSPNPFMPVHPHILAQEGMHVPYIIGHTSREGMFYLIDEFSFSDVSKEEFFKILGQNPETLLTFGAHKVLKKYNLTLKQLLRLYYKGENINMKNVDKFIDFISDIMFIDGIHSFVKNQVEKSTAPTYFYKFAYEKANTAIKQLISVKLPGASHCEELEYLFKMQFIDDLKLPHLKKGTESYKMMEKMTELWTNFAKYGKPTIGTSELIPVNWLPVTDGTVFRYLNIDEDLTMQKTLNIEQKYMSAANIKC